MTSAVSSARCLVCSAWFAAGQPWRTPSSPSPPRGRFQSPSAADRSNSVEDRPSAMPRLGLIGGGLAAVPEQVVELHRRNGPVEGTADQLDGVQGVRAYL